MRRFIIVTNKEGLELPEAKVIQMEKTDIKVMFNDDCLNVLNEREQEQVLNSNFMYGVEIEFSNYLIGYRQLLNNIFSFDQNIVGLYDVSIKRYINNHELRYFANNKLLPSKLFNIEIESEGNSCKYRTLGLKSIGLKEFSFETDRYLNEEDFQIFKAVVTNFVIGKNAKVNINSQYINYRVDETEGEFKFSYNRPPKIHEFFIRDDIYLDQIRYNLIAHHWSKFLQLSSEMPKLGNYLVNKAKINDLANFELGHVEEFTIVCDDINYNQDNLFYAYKYL